MMCSRLFLSENGNIVIYSKGVFHCRDSCGFRSSRPVSLSSKFILLFSLNFIPEWTRSGMKDVLRTSLSRWDAPRCGLFILIHSSPFSVILYHSSVDIYLEVGEGRPLLSEPSPIVRDELD